MYDGGWVFNDFGGRDTIMAFIPLPFGIKVEVAWETGSGVAVCIHFVSKTTPSAVTLTDLTNAIDSFDTWRISLNPIMAVNMQIAGIRATDWSMADGITALTVPGTAINGTNGTPILPLNVALVASHSTGRTGRSRRGRNYIPGAAESTVAVGDVIAAGTRNIITAAYNTLRTALLADGLVQVVASFHANGAPRVTGLGTAVSVTSVDQHSDSQRRRLAGRGA